MLQYLMNQVSVLISFVYYLYSIVIVLTIVIIIMITVDTEVNPTRNPLN